MNAKRSQTTRTPRQKMIIATPISTTTTSPYFTSSPQTLSTKRKAEDHPDETHMSPLALEQLFHTKKMEVTTSPYFSQTLTPAQTPVGKLATEDREEKKRERKRRKLMVRGDTPPAYVPPPPASPGALAEAMGRIKPELVQENVKDDPWKIIVATTMLNKTNGKVALPVYWSVLERWPTPLALAQASVPILMDLLRAIGTQSVRTQRLIRLSNAYTMHPPKFPLLAETHCLSTSVSPPTTRPQFKLPRQYTTKEYKSIQNASAIAHIPFAGPYAIDSLRIYAPNLQGGGAPSGVDKQLARIARLPRKRRAERDDFDETPQWYEPEFLYVAGDDDAEWRQVRPDDKQLRRYLVWRWAIEGVGYHPEDGHKFEPASWLYLNHLLRS